MEYSVASSVNKLNLPNMSEKFFLKWNDFTDNVSKSFGLLRNEEYLHDVTLVSDDHKQVPAHKLVLSACSEYFRDIFKNLNIHHVILCSCENHDRGLSTKIYIHKEGKMNTGRFVFPILVINMFFFLFWSSFYFIIISKC